MFAVYLAAFQAGLQLVSAARGGSDTAGLEALASLQRIENALGIANYNLHEINKTLLTEPERNAKNEVVRLSGEAVRDYEVLLASLRGNGELPRREIEEKFKDVAKLRRTFADFLEKLRYGLDMAKADGGPLEYYIVPLTVAAELGERLTAMSTVPALILQHINRDEFRTKHRVDYLESETIHDASTRLDRVSRLLADLEQAAKSYEKRWLTSALMVTPEATNADGVATLPVRALITRQRVFVEPHPGFQPALPSILARQPSPVMTMLVELCYELRIDSEGEVSVNEIAPNVTFNRDTWWKSADQRRAKLETAAPGRAVRIKASRKASVVKQKGQIAEIAKKNPLGLKLKGIDRIVAYELYQHLDADRKTMEATRISGLNPQNTVTWADLIGFAHAEAEKLSFVRQGVRFLTDRRMDIGGRIERFAGVADDG